MYNNYASVIEMLRVIYNAVDVSPKLAAAAAGPVHDS
jgi:hypothetical protein